MKRSQLSFYILLISTYHYSLAGEIQKNLDFKFKQPKPDQVLNQIQTANEKYLPRILNVATWNIQKSQNSENLKDLLYIVNQHQITLFQEMTDEKRIVTPLTQQFQQNINYAASFYLTNSNNSTGVMNLSTATPSWLQFRRSPGRETFVRTPKMTLIEEYMLSENDRLLVLNIHGLNFVDDQTFKSQINDITPLLKFYKYRVLFAGDFNTWNINRINWLKQRLGEYDLQHIKIDNDNRPLQLDHFFLRGCQLIKSKIFELITSSDHRPLSIQIDCH